VAVIRQFPDNSGCSVCNSLVDLPHSDVSECRIALAKEMDEILRRAHSIAGKRRDLTRKRLKELAGLHPGQLAKPRRTRRK
jgi:hypothetical protein